ncbi:imidazolonepropionase [Thalassobaculum sp. OXR-137]|uniref:imidazolonepropionase n=1 Tax=Thalassobaculum sp. OXR-137 TaxID=3100173 RepID=UPI002AC93C8B|nr:imidazolonepropionase [Thalassobaculum sp. OXR-137]WPZ36948.1 imidazolonepropionase [Thalassobaculum sp. OXR-137]
MWDALWTDIDIATCATADGYGRIDDGAIAVKDGQIAWIGPRSALPGPEEGLAAVRYSGERNWVTPALIDCHTHLVYGGQRAGEFEKRLAGASYAEISRAGGGIRATVAATRAASEADLLRSALRRLAPLVAEGVTVIEIKSGYGLDLDTELKMLRVARAIEREAPVEVITTFLGAHAVPPEFDGDADDYIDFVCDEVLPGAVEQGLVDQVDAFCETIAFSPEQVARVFEAARLFNLPVKLHAEQLSDYGGAELAAEAGALSADHLEYLSPVGVRAMARAGTVAVLLPGAFFTLNETRRPPVDRLREAGVPIALATDSNPGSSPVTSLLTAMNMGCVLFGLTPQEALAGVTRNAARALGIGDRRGTLEVGKAADFVIWDIEEPAELAYRIGFNPCVDVIRAGVPTLVA